jgi:hypothetical protein
MIKTHVIRPGDHLAKIAHAEGLDPEEVWSHPRNQELRDRRRDPNILCEGDVLFMEAPEEVSLPLKVGQVNRFSATVPRLVTHLCFKDSKGAFSGEAYVVEGLDEKIEGTTDGNGNLTIDAPVTAKIAKVVFTGRRLRFDVLLGEMDPITEVSGAQLRLALLGILKAPATGELDEETASALRAFQRSKRLPCTGGMDAPTLDALREAYGC